MRSSFNGTVLSAVTALTTSASLVQASPVNIDFSGETRVYEFIDTERFDVTPDPAPMWHFDIDFDGYTAGSFNDDYEKNFQLSNVDWMLTYQNPQNPSEILTNSGNSEVSIVYRANSSDNPENPDFSSLTFTIYSLAGVTNFQLFENDADFTFFSVNDDDLEAALYGLSGAFNDGSLFSANGSGVTSTVAELSGVHGSSGLLYDTTLNLFTVVPTPASVALLGFGGLASARRPKNDLG